MEPPKIEPATIEDLPELAELLVELFTHEADFRPDRERQIRGLQLILENPGRGRIFVARLNERIVGMVNVLFTISTAEGGFVALLEDFIVQHDFRGHGIGSLLLDHAIKCCREKGFLRITLLTERITEGRQQEFFRKHGFSESHMIPMRLAMRGGVGDE
jgi:GNAT superfamily N-acetyltransferase